MGRRWPALGLANTVRFPCRLPCRFPCHLPALRPRSAAMPAAALDCVLGAATPAQGAQESMPQHSAKRAAVRAAEHVQPATHELPRWLVASHPPAPASRLQAINHLLSTPDNLVDAIRTTRQRAVPVPMFGFNSDGLWQVAGPVGTGDPALRLSRSCEVMAKYRAEGLL